MRSVPPSSPRSLSPAEASLQPQRLCSACTGGVAARNLSFFLLYPAGASSWSSRGPARIRPLKARGRAARRGSRAGRRWGARWRRPRWIASCCASWWRRVGVARCAAAFGAAGCAALMLLAVLLATLLAALLPASQLGCRLCLLHPLRLLRLHWYSPLPRPPPPPQCAGSSRSCPHVCIAVPPASSASTPPATFSLAKIPPIVSSLAACQIPFHRFFLYFSPFVTPPFRTRRPAHR
jgi:hypothetical protein